MQRVDYYVVPGKRWEWHLVLFKEWLRHVESGISHRKYVKWLRTRKVYERGFIRFVEQLLGIVQKKKSAPRLNEIGEELADELKSSEAASAERQAALQAASAPPEPPPDAPPGARRRRRSDEELEQLNPGAEAIPKPPTAENDPFLKALLERLSELNPYLAQFVFKEVGDDFMSPTEVYRRMGTVDFVGVRPSMPMFDTYCTWLEWLGGLQKVGFRHKLGEAGKELAAYLTEVPVEELLEGDDEDDEDAEDAGAEDAEGADEAPEAEAEAGAGAEAGAEVLHDPELDELGDDGFLDDEGLDLPPEAEVADDAEQYWSAPEPPPSEGLLPGLEALTADLRRMRGEDVDDVQPVIPPPIPLPGQAPAVTSASEPEAEPPRPATPKPAPASIAAPPKAAAAPKAAAPKAAAPKAAPAPPPPVARAAGGTERAALRQAVAWWLRDERLEAASPVDLSPHPSGKPVGVFKLLTLATLLEAEVEPRQAQALFERLDASGTLTAMLVDAAPLDPVLEAAWGEPVPHSLEERLVHLVRYRAGLLHHPEALVATDVRGLAHQLRQHVTGETLGPGLLLVIRALVADGQVPEAGLEAVAWLPSLLSV